MITRRSVLGSGMMLAAAGLLPGRALADDGVIVNDIALEDGRVWIAASIEGKGPYHFLIDTGATQSFIEDGFARSLRLEAVRGHPMRGVGGHVADYNWYRAKQVVVGNGTGLPDALFAGIGKRLNNDAVGAFGAGLFTGYDSDLDFAHGQWRVYQHGRPNFDGLVKLPSRLNPSNGAARIEVDATIDGFACDWLVDTGAPGLSLTGRAAAKSGLWDSGKPYAPSMAYGLGDGAGTRSRIMRADRFKVGPFVFEKMLVTLNQPGSLSGDQAGIMGLEALQLLDLTTDVSHATLWARPNGRPTPRRSYPLSGLWIDDVKGRVTVSDVGIGSPAAAAGVHVGDVLAGGDLRTLIRTINGPAGKQVALRIDRGGAQQDVRYTLTDYF